MSQPQRSRAPLSREVSWKLLAHSRRQASRPRSLPLPLARAGEGEPMVLKVGAQPQPEESEQTRTLTAARAARVAPGTRPVPEVVALAEAQAFPRAPPWRAAPLPGHGHE